MNMKRVDYQKLDETMIIAKQDLHVYQKQKNNNDYEGFEQMVTSILPHTLSIQL